MLHVRRVMIVGASALVLMLLAFGVFSLISSFQRNQETQKRAAAREKSAEQSWNASVEDKKWQAQAAETARTRLPPTETAAIRAEVLRRARRSLGDTTLQMSEIGAAQAHNGEWWARVFVKVAGSPAKGATAFLRRTEAGWHVAFLGTVGANKVVPPETKKPLGADF